MAWRSVRDQGLSGRQGENADFAFGVDADQLVCTELNELGRRLARQRKDHRHSSLTENIDLTVTELRVACPDSEERLDGIVRDSTDPGVYTTSSELEEEEDKTSISMITSAIDVLSVAAPTYIIEGEQVRRQVLGEVLLDTGLLSPQKMRHSGGHGTEGMRLERRRRGKGR